jgi:hypothetical protein
VKHSKETISLHHDVDDDDEDSRQTTIDRSLLKERRNMLTGFSSNLLYEPMSKEPIVDNAPAPMMREMDVK